MERRRGPKCSYSRTRGRIKGEQKASFTNSKLNAKSRSMKPNRFKDPKKVAKKPSKTKYNQKAKFKSKNAKMQNSKVQKHILRGDWIQKELLEDKMQSGAGAGA